MSERVFRVPTAFPLQPAPGVRVYKTPGVEEYQVADHGGWVDGLFPTVEEAVAAAEPCDDTCGCLTEEEQG